MKIMELLSLRMSPTGSLWKHEIPVGLLASLHNEQDPLRSITEYTALQTQDGGYTCMRARRKSFGRSGGSSTRCSKSPHAQYDQQANNVYRLQPVFSIKPTKCSTANVKRALCCEQPSHSNGVHVRILVHTYKESYGIIPVLISGC
jgi:hypothetical protein